MPLTRMDMDDAQMEGVTRADKMLGEVRDEFNAPAMQARNAAGWHQLLQEIAKQESERTGQTVTPQMVEQMLKQQSPQRYEEVKKRFIAGGANGKT